MSVQSRIASVEAITLLLQFNVCQMVKSLVRMHGAKPAI